MATNTLRPKKNGKPQLKASGRAPNGAATLLKALFGEFNKLSAFAMLTATSPVAPLRPTVVATRLTAAAGQYSPGAVVCGPQRGSPRVTASSRKSTEEPVSKKLPG